MVLRSFSRARLASVEMKSPVVTIVSKRDGRWFWQKLRFVLRGRICDLCLTDRFLIPEFRPEPGLRNADAVWSESGFVLFV